jgi:hypothetical protein
VFGGIKREVRRRSANRSHEGDGHLGRCYLKGAAGANVILSRPQSPPRPRLRLLLIAIGSLFTSPTVLISVS